jgi:hypothetical protein
MESWRANGSPRQQGMAWPRERWIDHLPEHEGLLEAVPDVLDRETVRRACADANVDGTRAAAAFITVMAWGYGGVGYGPHRTRRILTGTPDAGDRLAEASRRLGKHGASAAYASLSRMDACRLVGLGPAFGTKYLYFSQARPADTTALILDSFVASWVRRETDLDLNPLGWSVATYQRYVDQMHQWAATLGCASDDLESSIFQAMAKERDSQWSRGRVNALVAGPGGQPRGPRH